MLSCRIKVKYHKTLFFKFLYGDGPSTVFAHMEIIGAMDLYAKSKFCYLQIAELFDQNHTIDLNVER